MDKRAGGEDVSQSTLHKIILHFEPQLKIIILCEIITKTPNNSFRYCIIISTYLFFSSSPSPNTPELKTLNTPKLKTRRKLPWGELWPQKTINKVTDTWLGWEELDWGLRRGWLR